MIEPEELEHIFEGIGIEASSFRMVKAKKVGVMLYPNQAQMTTIMFPDNGPLVVDMQTGVTDDESGTEIEEIEKQVNILAAAATKLKELLA